MVKIIMDLEFCKVDKKNYPDKRKISRCEVIQIGAVKLNEHNEIIDEFDMLVKPIYSVINKDISNLTHITNELVEDKPDYACVMDEFISWIGEEEFSIFTWSMEDMKQIKCESALREYNNDLLDYIYDNWFDLQKMFGERLGIEQQISLTNALKAGDIEFEGLVHTACADARNTAKIYQVMEDDNMFDKIYRAVKDVFTPTEELTFTMGSLFSGLTIEGMAMAG